MSGAALVRAVAVTASSSAQCLADIAGVQTLIDVARDLTVAAGDPLLVARYASGHTQWVAVARLGATSPAVPAQNPAPAPPDPKPATRTGVTVFAPVETRSYRSGSWRTDNTDVYQGQYGSNGNHTGCAFYGRGPRSLSGATVTAATVRVQRPDYGGANAAQSTTMRLVAESTRPSGAPTLGSTTAGPHLRRGQTTNAFTVPASWAQGMVDGSAGGIGFFDSTGSPYVIFAGRGTWSAAFALTIYWTRSG